MRENGDITCSHQDITIATGIGGYHANSVDTCIRICVVRILQGRICSIAKVPGRLVAFVERSAKFTRVKDPKSGYL